MRKEIILMVMLMLLVATSSGCLGQRGSSVAEFESPAFLGEAQKAASYAPASEATERASDAAERKIIRTAYLDIEVDDFDEASFNVERTVESLGGFISDSSSYVTDKGKKRGTITARVPEDKLTAAISEIEKVGKVESKRVSGQDVTEEYIDLEARLNNSRRTEARLLDILDKAEKVEDIVTVEKELARVREDIERLTGRMRYLNNRIDLATITVKLYEPEPITQTWGLRDAVIRSVRAFIGSVNGIIVFVGGALPVAIFLLVLYYLFRRRKGKK